MLKQVPLGPAIAKMEDIPTRKLTTWFLIFLFLSGIAHTQSESCNPQDPTECRCSLSAMGQDTGQASPCYESATFALDSSFNSLHGCCISNNTCIDRNCYYKVVLTGTAAQGQSCEWLLRGPGAPANPTTASTFGWSSNSTYLKCGADNNFELSAGGKVVYKAKVMCGNCGSSGGGQ